MPSTVWQGRIAFGLVAIPVRLYKAAAQKRVQFHNVYCPAGALAAAGSAPIGLLAKDDLRKAYEPEPNQYVLFTDSELEALRAHASKNLEITEFVRLDEIDRNYRIVLRRARPRRRESVRAVLPGARRDRVRGNRRTDHAQARIPGGH